MASTSPVTRHSAHAAACRSAARPRTALHIFKQRCRSVAARSASEYKELLAELRGLDDGALAAWATGADNRERLSLPFLGWLSEEELAASADEPDEQQALWELGSKLMALREGLSPVGAEVLQEELRAAALRCSGVVPPEAGKEQAGGSGASQRPQDAAQPAAGASQQQQSAALVTPAFSSSVAATAALGLSPEGLSLFEQQAAALEAVVGTARARSLTEVIGRARVQEGAQAQGLAEADAAVRILDVLLSVTEREERAAMLPDAFTPPGSTAAVDDDAAYFSPDEEQLYTTPLRLLQAIDLYLSRLAGSGGTAPRDRLPAFVGGGLGMSAAQLQMVLRELREDVEQLWAYSDSDAC